MKRNIWKTIKLGTCYYYGHYWRALREAGCRIDDYVNEAFGMRIFRIAEQEQEIDLANLSVAELGFEKGAEYHEICQRAVELGYALCEPEDGPALRIQYLDQPKNENEFCDEELYVGMKPLEIMNASRVFLIRRSGNVLWLHCTQVEYAKRERFLDRLGDRPRFHSGCRFVFRCPSGN